MQNAIILINNAMKVWNFDMAKVLYVENFNAMPMECINFLYQTGNIDKIFEILSNFKQIPRWWDNKLFEKSFDDFKVLIVNIINSKGPPQSHIEAAFSINRLLANHSLCFDDFVKFFAHIVESPTLEVFDNKWRNQTDKRLVRSYVLQKCIEYFEICEDKKFFVHLSNRIPLVMQACFDLKEYGPKIYYNRFLLNSKKFSFNNPCIRTNKRVAVLISGIFRGDWKQILTKTLKNIVEPISADCFIFSWDNFACWPGVTAGENWCRYLPSSIINAAPREITNKSFLRANFPKVYEKIEKEYGIPISRDEVMAISPNIKNCFLMNSNEFIGKYGYLPNTSKMFFGFYKSLCLMQKFERENEFEYDFIIRIRPEGFFSKKITLQELESIPQQEIKNVYCNSGVSDMLFYGRRHTMSIVCKLWEFASLNVHLPLFRDFPRFPFVHTCFAQYLLLNDIKLSFFDEGLFYHFSSDMAKVGTLFPDVSCELSHDIELLQKDNRFTPIEIKSFRLFFENIYKSCNKVSTISINNTFKTAIVSVLGAKDRIHNHLAYKLGSAMILNSKSLLGYIRMPYVLSYIKEAHQKEQKEYQAKTTKNPKLKLPKLESYVDYKEALKEKECFTYKLGEALIKANSVRGGGRIFAYLAFFKEVRRLRRELKEKRK